MDFPFLSVITFLPAAGAILLLLLPKDRKTEARVLAAATAFAALLAEVTFIKTVAACTIGLQRQCTVLQAGRVVVTGGVVILEDLSHVRLLLR